MGPGGEWLTRARWIALFGDETSLPAIARILQDLPPESEGTATILTSDAGDKQELNTNSNVSIRWLVRGDGICLVHELKRLKIPDNDRLVWFAGERSEVNQAREVLVSLGLRKDEIRAASYWTR
jgi:NADPH-dependent ferric siderophore reductase